MTNPILPKPLAALVGRDGRTTPEFYRWFGRLAKALDDGTLTDETLREDLRKIVIALGAASGDPGELDVDSLLSGKLDASALVVGLNSVISAGTLAAGRVNVFLDGDTDDVPATGFYGSSTDASRGWFRLFDALAAGVGLVKRMDGYTIVGEVAEPAELPGSGNAGEAYLVGPDLYAWTGAAWESQGAATGIPEYALAQLADTGSGAALVKITRDPYGRVAGTQAANTDDLPEGVANRYFTNARVAAALAAGTNVALSVDGSGVTTISASGGGGSATFNRIDTNGDVRVTADGHLRTTN